MWTGREGNRGRGTGKRCENIDFKKASPMKWEERTDTKGVREVGFQSQKDTQCVIPLG